MLVREAREQYIRWLFTTRDLSPHTTRAYGLDIVALERFLGNDARVRQIDSDALGTFFEHQRLAGLSSTSIRRRAAGIRGFSRWLVSCGLLERDLSVAAHVAAGRSRRLPRTVPEHDLKRLLVFLRSMAGIDGSITPIQILRRPFESTTLLAVALMVTTGMRVNETVGIRCDDVNLPSRTLRLVGKGRRERQVFLTNEWIADLTAQYLAARVELDLRHSHLLFNVHFDPLSPGALRSRLAKTAQDAALDSRVTPHMLRHTAATQLIEAGVDIRFIQRLLGHASLSTTEIYTHVSDDSLKRVVSDADVLGNALMR